MKGSQESQEAAPPWRALWVLALGLAMIVLDSSIVNVSIPSIIAAIHINLAQAQWVTALYSIVLAALLLPSGRLGDMIGRKRILQVGTVIFVLGSVFAASASSGALLLLARLVQGIGGSLVMPSTLSTVSAAFRGRHRATAFGIWGAVMSSAAAVGPFLGGAFTSTIGWRWIFLVNLPLGLIVFLASAAFVPETKSAPRQTGDRWGMLADWKGILLSALGSALVVFALIEGQTYGWWRPRAALELGPLYLSTSAPLSPVPVSLLLGLALLAAFALTELTRARKGKIVILDVSMFAIGTFGWGNLTAAIVNAGQFAVMFILPLYLINARGLSPLGAGSILGVMALGSVVSGGLARVVSARLGAGGTVQTGLLMEIVGVALSILLMRGSMPVWPMTLALIIYGAGLGFASAQLTSLVLSGVPVAQSGQASATQSTIRQWGTALGAAVSGSVLSLALSLVLPRHLTALKGISAQVADGLVKSVQTSAGNAIVGLRAQGTRGRLGALGPQVTHALTEGFTQGAQWAMGFAVLLLLLGLIASVLVRRAARKAGADKV
ncbi:MFS transporter [uncultured Bifidobacterium sp.]|uniref:MFS transporter n=1 Tax=uncultured Bifidobacterium sp. TaxID=165187 RepID=UPI0025E438A6|nr:MFS transporter [uncultured Bifidobacterium sp.]